MQLIPPLHPPYALGDALLQREQSQVTPAACVDRSVCLSPLQFVEFHL